MVAPSAVMAGTVIGAARSISRDCRDIGDEGIAPVADAVGDEIGPRLIGLEPDDQLVALADFDASGAPRDRAVFQAQP